MLLVLHKMVFLENEAGQQCVTMRKQARAFVATIERIIFCIHFANENFGFSGELFKRILAWEGGTCKTWFLD